MNENHHKHDTAALDAADKSLVTVTGFIGEASGAVPRDLCDRIIAKFDAAPESVKRWHLGNECKQVLGMSSADGWQDLDDELFPYVNRALLGYMAHFKDFWTGKGVEDSGYLVGKYAKGVGHYDWHIDIHPGEQFDIIRYLGILVYLNDVAEGGHTEYRYQDKAIAPEVGKIVFVPTDWTHMHRGATPISSDKYIVTSYLLYTKHLVPRYNPAIQLIAENVEFHNSNASCVVLERDGEGNIKSMEVK